MIIFYGIFDLLTILLSFASIYFSVYKNAAIISLVILGFKGLWTLNTTKNVLDPLGLIDLGACVATLLTIQFGLFTKFSVVMLLLLGWKSYISIKPF
ncbi:Uncharacterised protein [Candidatus Tiddalikarchaeum anstoanum]|nr:Uncharacterised protein [Candidatus Tiddalikarchaeum anstoanum]